MAKLHSLDPKAHGSGTSSIDEVLAGVVDELQAQAERASKVIKKALSNPADVNKDLVKRGEALADQITDLLKRSGAPASRQLDKQLDELRKAVDKLKRKAQG